MFLKHNPADHKEMLGQHNEFTDTVCDAVIRIQDEAYALGLKRGRAEAAPLAECLKAAAEALEHKGAELHAARCREVLAQRDKEQA